jgi:Flp pilus assembly protein TadG
MVCFSGMIEVFRSYLSQRIATIAIMFALMAPLLIGAAGMSLDYAQAYLVRQRLMQALDAAALAAAAASGDSAQITQKVKDFFNANYPEEKIGFTFEPVVKVSGDEVTVTGTARFDTMFLPVLGIDYINVSAQTVVVREVQGLEVVMVLDNTGSMSTNNNIAALKDGSKNFINILFGATSNPEFIRIGMVPYSNSVRIGRYGLGQKPDGSQYADGDVFVQLPAGVTYTNDWTSANWYGCVIEHKGSGYSSSATHATGTKGQLWKNGTSWDGHGWNPAVNTNDPYDYDTFDDYEGPWDIYSFGRVISQNAKCSDLSGYATARCSSCLTNGTNKDKCNTNYCFCWGSDANGGTNQGCPTAYVMPLSSDQNALLAHVDTMSTEGNTLGNIGMVWGARMISPEAPFEEAHDWDNEYWKKAVVMMTDGDNTENATYSSYWFTAKNNMSVTKFNDRFAETCEALKEKGVTVYTVTFTSGINNQTKEYYKDCATSEDHYFDAPSQTELKDAFERIARELSNLHIKE